MAKRRPPEKIPRRCEAATIHARGCHPKRPRCRWRRQANQKWKLCNCGAYHFTHRRGSGRCLNGKNLEAQWRHLYGDEAVDAWLASEQAQATAVARSIGA